MSKSSQLKRLGLFGGSFDPIHQGHLQIAFQALREFDLDAVHFITARANPHKITPLQEDLFAQKTFKKLAADSKTKLLSAEQRHELVKAAIAAEPRFFASDIELKRSAPSYSSDTIAEYQSAYPSAKLFWILGEDAYDSLATWHAKEKFSEIELIVCPRAKVENETQIERENQTVLSQGDAVLEQKKEISRRIHKFLSQDKVHFLNSTLIPISSSSIRNLLLAPPDNLEDKLKELVPAVIKSQLHEYYS